MLYSCQIQWELERVTVRESYSERELQWERGGHAAKDHGPASNQGRFRKDSALMVRALPGKSPGRPTHNPISRLQICHSLYRLHSFKTLFKLNWLNILLQRASIVVVIWVKRNVECNDGHIKIKSSAESEWIVARPCYHLAPPTLKGERQMISWN